jgi:glycosyltransferase involved in cell wall biosynthesis
VRITIDYTPALRQSAGIGRYTRGLVGALAALDRQNQYTLFCAGRAPGADSTGAAGWPSNFRVRVVPWQARHLGIAWHRLHLPLPAEWLAGPTDLFHSPDFTLPPLARARGVVTVHDLSFLTVPECADPRLRAFLERAVPGAVRRARRVLADSASTANDLNRLLGVPAEKISIVPAGIEARFQPVRDPACLARVRARYSLPERFILGLGTLEPRKNFVRLIQAYAELQRRAPLPQNLVIAGGPGWLYEGIYAEARRQAAPERICFPGFVADEDLPALYTLADAFAFPSLYEGFGIPPLEAMGCGTPVICANNSSLPEAVGDAALLVDATDVGGLAGGLLGLLGDGALRARLVTAGLARAGRFTWSDAAAGLLAAYRQAML